jgi:hypothetical protein
MLVGVGIMAYGAVALFVSDKAEEKLGWVATEKDKEELNKLIPKITPVEKSGR